MSDIKPINEGAPGDIDVGGSVDALSHDIKTQADDLLAEHPGIEVLDVQELQTVFRLASNGVLRRLSDQGVRGAFGLQGKLDAVAETDGFADIHDVAERLRRAEAMGAELGDANAQAEQHRLGLLADAVGGTASAIVASVLTPDGAEHVITRARSMVGEYRSGSKSDPTRSILDGFLDEVEGRRPGSLDPKSR